MNRSGRPAVIGWQFILICVLLMVAVVFTGVGQRTICIAGTDAAGTAGFTIPALAAIGTGRAVGRPGTSFALDWQRIDKQDKYEDKTGS